MSAMGRPEPEYLEFAARRGSTESRKSLATHRKGLALGLAPFTRWRTTERARITAGAWYSAFPIDRCEQASRVNNDIIRLILYY